MMNQEVAQVKQKTVPMAPPPPKRCPIDPLVCYAVDGFMEGLEDRGFPMGMLPTFFAKELKADGYEMPDRIWDAINLMDSDEQSKIIYGMIKNVHISRAVYSVQKGERPLGLLEGREHLALPLELAGEEHFMELLTELAPLLQSKFGLNRASIWGKTGQDEYPKVISLYYKNREQFFRVYRFQTPEQMMDFLGQLDKKIGWPEVLVAPFRERDVAERAIEQISKHL